MLYFIYGPDKYRMRQCAKGVEKKHTSDVANKASIFSFDMEEGNNWALLENALKTSSLFDPLKLVKIQNALSRKDSAERLKKLIENYGVNKDKNIVLVINEVAEYADIKKRSVETLKYLKQNSDEAFYIPFLSGQELYSWINSEFKQRGVSVDREVVRKLVNSVGNESWKLIGEINKLSNLRDRGVVSETDVDLLTTGDLSLNIFDLIDAVASKSRTTAIELLYKELASGRDPYYILTMITYQFRNLLTVKDLSQKASTAAYIAKKSRLHPFVIKKTIVQSNKMNLEGLKRNYADLMRIDVQSKRGVVNLSDELYNFVLSA
jgi:DNA polymerase-3 subunit delta